MTVFTEGQHNLEYFVSEANESRSREGIKLVADAAVYKSGTVLALEGTQSDGVDLYERFDGVNTAAAILYHDTDAVGAIADAVAHVRDMEYKEGKLVFLDAATGPHKLAAKASLKALGVIARATN